MKHFVHAGVIVLVFLAALGNAVLGNTNCGSSQPVQVGPESIVVPQSSTGQLWYSFQSQRDHLYHITTAPGNQCNGATRLYSDQCTALTTSFGWGAWPRGEYIVGNGRTMNIAAQRTSPFCDWIVSINDYGIVADDHRTGDTATPIADNQWVYGDIEYPSDSDEFVLTNTVEGVYNITIDNRSDRADSDSAISMTVTGSARAIASVQEIRNGRVFNDYVYASAANVGTLRLRVNSAIGSRAVPISYRAKISRVFDLPHRAGAAQCALATPLPNDGTLQLASVSSPASWFQTSIVQGHVYHIEVLRASSANVNDTSTFYIRSDCGDSSSVTGSNILAYHAPSTGSISLMIPVNTESELFRVRVLDGGLLQDDQAGGPPAARILPADGVPVLGLIDYRGDVDWFTVDAPPESLIEISLKPLADILNWDITWQEGNRTPVRYQWQYNSDYPYIPITGYTPWTSTYVVPQADSGPLRLSIANQSICGYQLKARILAIDVTSPAGSCERPHPISVDGPSLLTVIRSYEERVVVGAELRAHSRYELQMSQPTISGTPTVQIFLPDCGGAIGAPENSGFTTLPIFETHHAGVYTFKLGSMSGVANAANLRLVYQGDAEDEVGDTPATATDFQIGGRILFGNINTYSDVDVYAITLPPRSTYHAQFASLTPFGTAVCATLDNPAGNTRMTNYGSGTLRDQLQRNPLVLTNTSDSSRVISLGVWLDGQYGLLQYALRVVQPNCRGDWNGSGSLSVHDVFVFLADFFSRQADFNADLQTNSVDLFDFLNAWFGVCEN